MQSKASVCGRPLSGIPCSNSFEGMIVSLLWVLCVVTWRCLRQPDPSSREVLPRVCVSLSMVRCNNNPLHRQWVGRRSQTQKERDKKERNCVPKLWHHISHISVKNLSGKNMNIILDIIGRPVFFKRVSVTKYLSVIMQQGRKLCYFAVNDSGVWN
jgi:hypothetical protein